MENIVLSEFIIKIVFAIIIFFVGKKIAQYITTITIKTLVKTKQVDTTLEKFLQSTIFGVLLLFIIITVLGILGVETTSFIALIGAIGLAIGLSFKDTLSNLSAGVMIILFKPIKVGEFAEVGGTSGTVEEINIFHTILKTGDNKTIIVSNSRVIGNNITNYSRKETRRVDITFGVSYDDDIKLVKETLEAIIEADERILKDPKPLVAVSELADSSVNFITRSWVNSSDYWGVYFDMLEKVKLAFDEKGISIPYPQMDIHKK